MTTRIFLSVGRTFNEKQEEFVSELESFMQSHGLTPQTVGRTYFSSEQPLKAVSALMRECAGTVIVAFERIHIKQGLEKRGSPNESQLSEENLPTVWNQIEAAMAYTLDHPLFVIVEENLRAEGLLERGYDWYVMRMQFRHEAFFEREFLGIFADWKNRVEAFAGHMLNAEKKASDIPLFAGETKNADARGLPISPPSADILEAFYRAMLQAYPTKPPLRQAILFGMDEEIDSIVGGETQSEMVLDLIAWARRVGRFEELVETAYKYNSGNPQLKSFVLTTFGKLPES